MSIRSLLSQNDQEIENYADEEANFDVSNVSKYAVRRYRPNSAGAVSVDGFDDLEEPIKKDEFADIIEKNGLPYGNYKLLALGGERNQILGTLWSLEDVGDRAALDGDRNGLQEQIAALRSEIDDDERTISTPSDGFALLIENVLDDDEINHDQLNHFQEILISWSKLNREPSCGLLAYELAHGFLQADSPKMAVRILDKWLRAEGSGSDLDLVELASAGDLDGLAEVDISTLAMLRLVDDPGEVAREVSTGLLEAAGDQDTGGASIGLED